MNKHNAKDYLPLVQALAEGKTIQGKYSDGEWGDIESLTCIEPPDRFRIKPEPLETWCAIDSEGLVAAYSDKFSAENAVKHGFAVRCAKFREVIE